MLSVFTVINMQLQDLKNRFNEANIKLLLCVPRFDLVIVFAFNVKSLLRHAQFYPMSMEFVILKHQLATYTKDMGQKMSFHL